MPVFYRIFWLEGEFRDAFSSRGGLPLPEYIGKRIDASIFQAIQENASGNGEMITQVQIYLEETAARIGANGLAGENWGYFLVQKRGDPQDRIQLLLNLYLYTE